MEEDTLIRFRRVLGEDHPESLTSASRLANMLDKLGAHGVARTLREDVTARRRKHHRHNHQLPDHPDDQ
jgi:hypothetical protein